MPRKSREYYLSNFYHVMIQGDEKKFIFTKDRCKDKIIFLIKQNSIRNNIKLIAYCIMNNHAHILVCCKQIEDLSKMMSQCNTSYGLYYSKLRGRVGHVFRNRYRSESIFSKNHLMNCIKYIHKNPVKANMVEACQEYRYSSYNEYLNKNGIFDNELMELCNISEEEYSDIIKSCPSNFEYIDEPEDVILVFEEIKSKYKLDNIKDNEMVKIYLELFERCNITKTKFAELLNMDRKKVSRILCNYGYGQKK